MRWADGRAGHGNSTRNKGRAGAAKRPCNEERGVNRWVRAAEEKGGGARAAWCGEERGSLVLGCAQLLPALC